jgi:hypothetical protein
MRIFIAVSLAVALLGLSVVAADAAVVPPGNSAATQYSETLPGAGGEETSQKGGSGDKNEAAPGAPAVSPETAAELKELGAEGEAILDLTNSAAPPRHADKQGSAKKGEKGGSEKDGALPPAGGGPGAGGSGTNVTGSSGVGEVLGGAAGTSSGGLGFLQPLIIGLALVCAVAYALRRRRGDEPEPGSSLR